MHPETHRIALRRAVGERRGESCDAAVLMRRMPDALGAAGGRAPTPVSGPVPTSSRSRRCSSLGQLLWTLLPDDVLAQDEDVAGSCRPPGEVRAAAAWAVRVVRRTVVVRRQPRVHRAAGRAAQDAPSSRSRKRTSVLRGPLRRPLCVTAAMQAWLRDKWGVDARVLHDRPPALCAAAAAAAPRPPPPPRAALRLRPRGALLGATIWIGVGLGRADALRGEVARRLRRLRCHAARHAALPLDAPPDAAAIGGASASHRRVLHARRWRAGGRARRAAAGRTMAAAADSGAAPRRPVHVALDCRFQPTARCTPTRRRSLRALNGSSEVQTSSPWAASATPPQRAIAVPHRPRSFSGSPTTASRAAAAAASDDVQLSDGAACSSPLARQVRRPTSGER